MSEKHFDIHSYLIFMLRKYVDKDANPILFIEQSVKMRSGGKYHQFFAVFMNALKQTLETNSFFFELFFLEDDKGRMYLDLLLSGVPVMDKYINSVSPKNVWNSPVMKEYGFEPEVLRVDAFLYLTEYFFNHVKK